LIYQYCYSVTGAHRTLIPEKVTFKRLDFSKNEDWSGLVTRDWSLVSCKFSILEERGPGKKVVLLEKIISYAYLMHSESHP